MKIVFDDAELGEITAKLANELEDYQGEVTRALQSGFLKLVKACEASDAHIYVTTLMTKWANIIRSANQSE
jgi:hypothetical protein